MGASVLLAPPGVFNSETCPHWASSSLSNKLRYSYSSTSFRVVSACESQLQVSHDSLNFPFWFSSLGGSDLPVSSTLLWIQEDMLILQSVQLLTCWDKVVTSNLLNIENCYWPKSLPSLPTEVEWKKIWRQSLEEIQNESHSVVSNSLWPVGLYSPWNSPGQNSGVGCLSLLQGIFPIQGSKMALIFSQQRGKNSSLMPQELCPFSVRSLGAYIR